MNRYKKAMKEIEESSILTDYLLYHDLDFEDLENFSPRTIKKALEWKSQQ